METRTISGAEGANSPVNAESRNASSQRRKGLSQKPGAYQPPNEAFANEYAAIGRRLRLLRLAYMGVDHQSEWCRRFNVGQSTWSQYENGVHIPRAHDVMALKRRLGVSIEWIYDGNEVLMPAELLHRIKEIEAAEGRGESILPRIRNTSAAAARKRA